MMMRSRPEPGSLMERLRGERFDAYLDQDIPSDTDSDVEAVLDAYLQADQARRAELINEAAGEPWECLEIFAHPQAVQAVRVGSLEPIRRGLLAEGMAIPHGDYRYVLMGLAKLDPSARLLGSDLAVVYRDVASLLPEASKTFIEDVLAGDRDESFLKGMGYAPKGAGSDFTYVRAFSYDDE